MSDSKAVGKSATKPRDIALALTWDGARWPVKALPAKARDFLRGKSRKLVIPSASEAARLFERDEISECRICWVPQLAGGEDVLAGAFLAPDGKRLGFRATKTIRFDDLCGVIYRRVRPAKGR